VAVDGIDLDVAPGEVVALLGPNGAGKSTTIDMLLGLTPPDAGTVRLWGLSPKQAGAAGHVGAVLQGGGLLGGVTVRELVELMRGLAPSPLPTSEVLAMARITEVADARADRLSGGQTQRVRFGHSLTTGGQGGAGRAAGQPGSRPGGGGEGRGEGGGRHHREDRGEDHERGYADRYPALRPRAVPKHPQRKWAEIAGAGEGGGWWRAAGGGGPVIHRRFLSTDVP